MSSEKFNQEDSSENWMNVSMIFARALAILLDDNQGVVVALNEKTSTIYDNEVEKVIVYYKDELMRIAECNEDLEEGTIVMIPDINPN